MKSAQSSSGWRSLAPSLPMVGEPYSADKQELFEAARVAARALRLPSSCRFVLDQLCGVYGGELVEGRMLVWPSNEFLVERTGIPERSVRFALSRLIQIGVIAAKDSANGKRFAQRSPQGQIVRAFGFDLSPLLNRRDEFDSQLQAIRDMERERSAAFDDLTIQRRAAQEALRALSETFPHIDTEDLMKRALELVRVTPRRSGAGSADPFRSEWKAIREEAEGRYYTACGGNSCRHKDTNKYAPDQSCNNGYEDGEARKPIGETITAADLAKACPDAMEFIGSVRSDHEFVGAVSRMRGGFGVSPSAWDEATREIGPLGAAGALIYVVQMQMRPVSGSERIKNPGGYFRALIRLMRVGQFDLSKEIARLLRRH